MEELGIGSSRELGGIARLELMNAIRAVVRNGRLIVDEPTMLPEGSELELQLVDSGDELDDEERAALHRAIETGLEDARRGNTRPAEEVMRAPRPTITVRIVISKRAQSKSNQMSI
jgi:hypothetical protein